jgi:hypothetical protein
MRHLVILAPQQLCCPGLFQALHGRAVTSFLFVSLLCCFLAVTLSPPSSRLHLGAGSLPSFLSY